MRLIKMLGLAAVAAMVAMAFVGASSASADATHIVLCEKAELECGSPFPNPTTIVAHATNPELKTSLGTVICKKSLTETTLLNELSTLGVGHILALSFEECALGKTACTVTVTSLGLLSFVKTGALEGTAKSTGGTKANVHCGFLINCNYGGEPTLAVHSSATGETKLLATENTVLAEEGEKFVCPDESKWIATYTALGTMYIES
ncbi:MAG TPA: hypothetical protein VF245_11555 [Solirubrobacterales bacterium]